MPTAAVMAVAAVAGNVASNKARGDANRASSGAAAQSNALIREGQAQARQDLFTLFPAAQQSAQQGFQGAADVFRDVVPQQSQIFQQGNINAQNTLLSGLPQQQNAILGGPINNAALQPTTQFQPDFGFLNQQIGQQPQQGSTGLGQGGLTNQLMANLAQPTPQHRLTPQGQPSRFDVMQGFLDRTNWQNQQLINAVGGG